MRSNINKKGYTIIEIIVVIGIITVLTSIGFVEYQSARAIARDADRQVAIRQVADVLEVYQNVYGRLPDCNHGIKLEPGFPVYGAGGGVTEQTYNSSVHDCVDYVKLTSFLSNNLSEIPTDPLGADDPRYYYYYESAHSCYGGGTKDLLFAQMEVEESGNSEETCPQHPTDCTWANDGNYNCFSGQPNHPFVVSF